MSLRRGMIRWVGDLRDPVFRFQSIDKNLQLWLDTKESLNDEHVASSRFLVQLHS